MTLTHEVPRHGVSIAREILEDSPLLVVQGARQVGKSTLLRQALNEEEAHFVTLDDALALDYARHDPAGFVEQAGSRTLVIDEAQRAPELALALKASIDRDRRPGRFAITGSSDLLRLPGMSDSLAGRAESLRVYGLSQGEIAERKQPEDWVAWAVDGYQGLERWTEAGGAPDELRSAIIAGGYPEPLKRSDRRRQERWYGSYVERLATHDSRELGNGSRFSQYLETLLRVIANQPQAELVKSKVARSLGIAESSLGEYLTLAEMMYLIDITPGWGVGYSSRALKRPKVSIADTGLAAFLTGFSVEKSRVAGGFEHYGALVEAFVCGELLKQATWSRERFKIAHYRKRDIEIDIVIELADGRVVPVEVKSALSVDARAWKNVLRFGMEHQERCSAGVVLYHGSRAVTVEQDGFPVRVLPISSLWQHEDQ